MFFASHTRDDDFKDTVIVETDKNQLNIEKKGPYSFWYISIRKGNLPEYLKGAYTSKQLAIKDVTKWVESKDQQILTINE